MAENTVESLLNQFASLPQREKLRFRHLIDAWLNRAPEPEPETRFVVPIPEPDAEPNRRWMKAHRQEYAGQWVALDAERLIAHGADAQAVFAAAKADGAYLPLTAFIPEADEPPFAGV
jgi:hypothetical protein